MKALADVSAKVLSYKYKGSNTGQRHLGQYTTIDHESPYMLNAIKLDLNQKLGITSPVTGWYHRCYDNRAEEVQIIRTVRYRCSK